MFRVVMLILLLGPVLSHAWAGMTVEEEISAAKRAVYLSRLQAAGVQESATVGKLAANPFVYKGTIVAVQARFVSMISESEALFKWDGLTAFVSGVPSDRFVQEEGVLLVGKVSGNKAWRTAAGAEMFLPHLQFVDAVETTFVDPAAYWVLGQFPSR